MSLITIVLLTTFYFNLISSGFRYGKHFWRKIGENEIELIQDLADRDNVDHKIDWADGSNTDYQFNPQVIARTNKYDLTRAIYTHGYPTSGPYLSQFFSCCRDQGNMDLEMQIDLRDGNNWSPQTVPIAPIMQFPLGETVTFDLKASDADGQTVKCELSTYWKSGIAGFDNQNYVAVSEDCELTVTLPAGGSAGDLYEVQIYLYTEDGDGNKIDIMPLDFTLEGISNTAVVPTCDIVTTVPANGFEVDIGGSLTVEFQVDSPSATALDVNVLDLSEYGSISPDGLRRNGISTFPANIYYTVDIPEYGVNDRSMDGLQVGGVIEVVDSNGLSALCRVGITILSDIDNDGTRDQEDSDMDGDGIANAVDLCDIFPDPGQPDNDGDGIPNACDNCPNDYNEDQDDADGDSLGDLCDNDRDGDGINNNMDNCPDTYNPGQEDTDLDGVGNICDSCPLSYNPGMAQFVDSDGDSVPDACDNCPNLYNPDQDDPDNDGAGDFDNSLFSYYACDNCPYRYNPDQRDTDMDGEGDWCDLPDSCTDRCDAFSVLLDDVQRSGGAICLTYTIERMYGGGLCDDALKTFTLNTCPGDNMNDFADLGVTINGQGNWNFDVRAKGIKINPPGADIAVNGEKTFELCMLDVFGDIADGDYSTSVTFQAWGERTNQAMQCQETHLVGLPCVSSAYGGYAAVGNEEVAMEDVYEIEEEGMKEGGKKWTDLVVMVCVVVVVFIAVIIGVLCKVRNVRQKQAEKEIVDAMNVTIENDEVQQEDKKDVEDGNGNGKEMNTECAEAEENVCTVPDVIR